MFAIFLIIHIFVGSTFAGSGVILALSLGFDTLPALLTFAGVGFALSFPVSWFLAKRIADGA